MEGTLVSCRAVPTNADLSSGRDLSRTPEMAMRLSCLAVQGLVTTPTMRAAGNYAPAVLFHALSIFRMLSSSSEEQVPAIFIATYSMDEIGC